MLFSQESLARRVSGETEPVWEKVREVPKVTIDFGEGRVVRRTLHGNVVTWVLDARGRTIDAIPGVMTAEAYGARLDEALRLVADVAARPEPERDAYLRARHGAAAERPSADDAQVRSPRRDVWKGRIETPTEVAVAAAAEGPVPALPSPRADGKALDPESLRADTRLNLEERDPRLHALLAEHGLAPLDGSLTRRVYRTVLATDLDDPWMGLGPLLSDG